jgi:MFS transporter, PHS family, inorganic phosphate transporter
MLLGLITTIFWIPGDEHTPDGTVKTLEQWEVGRGPNGFAKTRLARIVAVVYHWLVKFWDVIYMFLDSISGKEEAQRREWARTQAEMAVDEDDDES